MGDNSKGEGKGNGSGGVGCLKSLFSLLLIGFVLGFLFVFFGLGTDKGKHIVQDWLEKQFSMELTIESAKIGSSAEIVVENIASMDTDGKGVPDFKIKELRIGPKRDGTLRISAHKAMLNLMQGNDGGWTPSVFGNLGALPGKHMGDLSKLTENFRRQISIHITDSSISWTGENGVISTSVSGLFFDMKPLSLPEKDIYFYRLNAYNVLGSDSINIHNIEREWLASDAVDYVAADKLKRQSVVIAKGFWEIK